LSAWTGHGSKLASHEKCAPFACDGLLTLSVERNPLRAGLAYLVVTRCYGCGAVIEVRSVHPEPHRIELDDGA
jgi:hypothetical protein